MIEGPAWPLRLHNKYQREYCLENHKVKHLVNLIPFDLESVVRAYTSIDAPILISVLHGIGQYWPYF